jgi:hypothetical protein
VPDRAWEYESEAAKRKRKQANGDPSAGSTGKQLSATNPVWPRDFLPYDCPNVRIMTFNHNTAWQSFALHQNLRDHADHLLKELERARREPEVRRDFKEKLRCLW